MTIAENLAWRTSSRSSNGEKCVEVAPTADGVAIRHSKHPDAGTIVFTATAWAAFVDEACHGLRRPDPAATITKIDADTVIKSLSTAVELRFDEDEWSAFVAGAADGEFDFTGQSAVALRIA